MNEQEAIADVARLKRWMSYDVAQLKACIDGRIRGLNAIIEIEREVAEAALPRDPMACGYVLCKGVCTVDYGEGYLRCDTCGAL